MRVVPLGWLSCKLYHAAEVSKQKFKFENIFKRSLLWKSNIKN